jgi:hypothetical protein
MATPEYIKPKTKEKRSVLYNGLKEDNGNLNEFGKFTIASLVINLFYLLTNIAFWLWGNVWYIDSKILSVFFEDFILLLDVLIWFTYLPCIFVITIIQIVGMIKERKANIIYHYWKLSPPSPFLPEV